MSIPIHVICTGRNHGEWTRQCLESVLSQDYERFYITWVDDCSDPPDKAVLTAIEMLNVSSPRWRSGNKPGPCHRIIQRTHREGGLYNAYQVACMTPPGFAVFPIGGDDYLTRNDALTSIGRLYDDSECWYTHGASWCLTGDGKAGSFSAPVLHNDFRTHPFHWLPSSWRSELTPKVDPEDLKLGGWWFQTAGDVALYTPILEMCGVERIRHIEETLYYYRRHDGNDGKLSARLQGFYGWAARCKDKYSRLEKLEDVPIRTPHVLPFGIVFPPDVEHGVNVSAKTVDGQVTLGPY